MSWIGEDLEHQLMIVQGRLSAPKIYQFHAETADWSQTFDAADHGYETHDGFCQGSLHGDLLAIPTSLTDIKIIRVKVCLHHVQNAD